MMRQGGDNNPIFPIRTERFFHYDFGRAGRRRTHYALPPPPLAHLEPYPDL